LAGPEKTELVFAGWNGVDSRVEPGPHRSALFVSGWLPRYFYYVHKYIFTAAIYVIVFVLWILWVENQ